MSSFAANGPVCVSFRASFPCEIERISATRIQARDFLREQGVRSEEISACELALAEACNNAVQNATPAGRAQPIEVVVICARSKIQLHVIDHTSGFNWPENVAAPDCEDEHGRGLFFIQSLMDRASYFRGRAENTLVMRKIRAPAVSHPAVGQDGGLLRSRLVENQRALGEMARELCFRSETLAAICRCSADLGRSNDLQGFAERLMNDLLHIAAAEWYVVRTVQSPGRLVAFVTSSQPHFTDIQIDSPDRTAIEAESAILHRDIDFGLGRPLAKDDPLADAFPNASGLVHPIRVDQTLIGTLAIGRSSLENPFSVAQREVIRTFADFLAIQIMNARLRDEQLASRLLSHELEIARGIQLSLLPRQLPQLRGFGLTAFWQSARQIGGDFYDVLQVSDSVALLVIADVMGKGVPAAMFAALLRSLIRANPESMPRPGQLLARFNQLLFDDLSAVNMFITAQLVLLDLAARRIVVGNAGHCPLLLLGAPDTQVMEISAEGMPLGVLREAAFLETTVALPPQARLLLYTDGVTECRNPNGELFGEDRLRGWLASSSQPGNSCESLKEDLIAKLAAFEADAALQDDRTFLIVAEEMRRSEL